MLANAYGIVVIAIGVVGIGWIVWLMRDSDSDRLREDNARTYFDEHGHWPDETPEQALERRRAAASVAPTPVSRASSDGRV
jgi:hypothetical protein